MSEPIPLRDAHSRAGLVEPVVAKSHDDTVPGQTCPPDMEVRVAAITRTLFSNTICCHSRPGCSFVHRDGSFLFVFAQGVPSLVAFIPTSAPLCLPLRSDNIFVWLCSLSRYRSGSSRCTRHRAHAMHLLDVVRGTTWREEMNKLEFAGSPDEFFRW